LPFLSQQCIFLHVWPFKGAPQASPKRVAELEAQLDEVQVTLAWLRKSVKDLNSRLSTVQRQQKPPEDAVEPTNGEEPVFTPRPSESTAHLARRFRGG